MINYDYSSTYYSTPFCIKNVMSMFSAISLILHLANVGVAPLSYCSKKIYIFNDFFFFLPLFKLLLISSWASLCRWLLYEGLAESHRNYIQHLYFEDQCSKANKSWARENLKNWTVVIRGMMVMWSHCPWNHVTTLCEREDDLVWLCDSCLS